METEDTQEEDVDNLDATNIPRWIQSLADQGEVYSSPIDINISRTFEIQCSLLSWHNHDVPPKKMKLTNTGHTLTMSAKWHNERPSISNGPLPGTYVFSQIHFHWGKNDGEGSEHSIDGVRYPVEMHAVYFKANYLTQEAALKERDGIVVLVYLFKLQSGKNLAFQFLIKNILEVQKAYTSLKLNPQALDVFMKKFEKDYFLYWGTVTTSSCVHYVLWLVSREPVGVTTEQVDELRSLLNSADEPLQGNFRELQPCEKGRVFHVCPSSSKYATLLALP